LKGSLGSDQLTSVERIIANPFASNNLIDASTAAAPSFIEVDLSISRLIVRNVPLLGALNFTVNNFDDVSGTNQDDFIKVIVKIIVCEEMGVTTPFSARQETIPLTGEQAMIPPTIGD